MPIVRPTNLMLEDFVSRYNSIKNALMRDKAIKSIELWNDIGIRILNTYKTFVEETNLGEGELPSKTSTAIQLLLQKSSRQSNTAISIAKKLEKIWEAKTKAQAKQLAQELNLSDQQFELLIKKREELPQYPPYEDVQLQTVKNTPPSRPPSPAVKQQPIPQKPDEDGDDEVEIRQEKLSTGEGDYISAFDPELKKLLGQG